MRAIIFKEDEWWVGQCIEKDIAVQAKSFKGVKEEFQRVLRVYKKLEKQEGNYSFSNHPVTPLEVIQRLKGETIEIGDV